jgi:hypothetical protein
MGRHTRWGPECYRGLTLQHPTRPPLGCTYFFQSVGALCMSGARAGNNDCAGTPVTDTLNPAAIARAVERDKVGKCAATLDHIWTVHRRQVRQRQAIRTW